MILIFFLVSILFSFLCSIWEAVLLSISPSYAEVLAKESPGIGATLKAFKANIDRPLAAILTLNTLAHTVGAIGVGAEAAKLWHDNSYNIFGFNLSMEAIIAGGMTLAILIISEIIPKTLGATYWKGLSKFTIRSVQFVIWILYPLVWVSQWITKLLKKDSEKSVLSRTDFTIMADIGAREGVIKEDEYRIFKNLMEFENVTAKEIMTPRTVMHAEESSTTLKAFYDAHPKLRFSRIPVFKDQIDEMHGYVLKDELLQQLVEGNGDKPLSEIQREFIVVPHNEKIDRIFEKLTQQREQIALVVGEYGGVAGIVTTEDIIETLFGLEIMDELDSNADMQKLAKDKWKSKAQQMGIDQSNA